MATYKKSDSRYIDPQIPNGFDPNKWIVFLDLIDSYNSNIGYELDEPSIYLDQINLVESLGRTLLSPKNYFDDYTSSSIKKASPRIIFTCYNQDSNQLIFESDGDPYQVVRTNSNPATLIWDKTLFVKSSFLEHFIDAYMRQQFIPIPLSQKSTKQVAGKKHSADVPGITSVNPFDDDTWSKAFNF